MIRRPPRSTQSRSSAASDVYKRQVTEGASTLPVVLDDILVTHDDGRTAVALEVLAEEARDQQILLMTHHSAVAEAARLTSATVVKLAPLANSRSQPWRGPDTTGER